MFWSLAAWDFTTEVYAILLCRVDVTDAYLKEYMSAISFRDHIPNVCPTNVFKLVKLHIKSSLFPGSQLVARVNDLKWMEQSVESLSLLYLQKILHRAYEYLGNYERTKMYHWVYVCWYANVKVQTPEDFYYLLNFWKNISISSSPEVSCIPHMSEIS